MTRIQFNLAMKYWQANYNERGEMKYPKETNRYFRQSTKKLREEDEYNSIDPKRRKSGKMPYGGLGNRKYDNDFDDDDSFSVERSAERRPERRLTPRRHTSKHLNFRHESPDGYLSDRGRPKPGHDTLPVDI
jgi:predicted HicB family RNase H-like nuclease